MDYVWLKALHVAAMLVFVGALFAQSVALAAAARGGVADAAGAGLLAGVRRWDRLVTVPALLLVWDPGAAAAAWGGWFGEGWLFTKLVLVVLLSGLHGVQAGAVRRLTTRAAPTPGWLVRAPAAVALAVALIAVLAVVKPF